MTVGILGYGREGKALLGFLKKDRAYRNAKFVVLDRDSEVDIPRGVELRIGKEYTQSLEDLDVIFRSPGIPYLLPELQRAKQRGVRISSATQLFFERCPGTIIGITGTKGKGTTATLLFNMLKAAGKPAFLAGNIGLPAISILHKLNRQSIVVLELSSFQLHDITLSPHIAVVLDLYPDHQDIHKTLKEYYGAKSAITRYQSPKDVVFFPAGNSHTKAVAHAGRGKKISVSDEGFALFNQQDLKLAGQHNLKNAMIAARVAEFLKVKKEAIRKAAIAFRGNEHRLEFVARINGIRFFNDSASTTPESTIAAFRSFPEDQVVLIAGGKDKGLNYAPVLQALRRRESKNIVGVVLFGENKKKIEAAIHPSPASIVIADQLADALREAYDMLRPYAEKHMPCTIVFSPGATSFDMFKNYADRGTQFKKLVSGLASR